MACHSNGTMHSCAQHANWLDAVCQLISMPVSIGEAEAPLLHGDVQVTTGSHWTGQISATHSRAEQLPVYQATSSKIWQGTSAPDPAVNYCA